jgi:6,7-dimethyl-8-ribityllumazine synthase
MRWLAALAAGFAAAVALGALIYGQNSFDDWQSNRAAVLAQIASIERDPGYPNRDRDLQSARELMDLTNGVVIERVGFSALALALAVGAFVALWRYAARFFSRARLAVFVSLGAVISGAVAGLIVVVMFAAGTIRG